MTAAFIILVPFAAAAVIAAYHFWVAPRGWQDSTGFHYGNPPEDGEV